QQLTGAGLRPLGRLIDAMVVLLARLHLVGFLWGDVSLSNTLFRRDAGEFAAYLVDAETGELHNSLSTGQREHDLHIARTNLFGEFLDLQAGGLLDSALDPFTLVEQIESRYRELWDELTAPEEFDESQMHRIEGRVRRLNALGFDIAELDITTDMDGTSIRIQPKVVDPGHHSRRLLRLTGLDTEENQARRLLNDLDSFRVRTDQQGVDEAVGAHQWLTECFEPVIRAVPAHLLAKRDVAQLYHEFLDYRWYRSEAAGREVPLADAATGYVDEVLAQLPNEDLPEDDMEVIGFAGRRWANPFDPTEGYAEDGPAGPTEPAEPWQEVPAGTPEPTEHLDIDSLRRRAAD
ncbi:MAG: DUF4032 domain-containing protein, partial [Propionibacteriaceae bacterium]|nr:DUF4032 domain-containing protein [Propionibacteriaceae bacterium]